MSHKPKRYTSEVTKVQGMYLRALLPDRTGKGGRPMTLAMRDVMNAIFYVLRTGCQWTHLPGDYPNCQSVYYLPLSQVVSGR